MTKETPTPAADTGLPKKTLAECQHDAVILSGLMEAIDYLSEDQCRAGQATLIIIANERARALANDLDRVKPGGKS
jgi:hypothetical protein